MNTYVTYSMTFGFSGYLAFSSHGSFQCGNLYSNTLPSSPTTWGSQTVLLWGHVSRWICCSVFGLRFTQTMYMIWIQKYVYMVFIYIYICVLGVLGWAVLFSEHKQIYEMTADQPKNNKDNLDGIAGLGNLVPVKINLRLIGEHGSRSFPLLKFHRFGAGSEKNREDVRHPKSISRVACMLFWSRPCKWNRMIGCMADGPNIICLQDFLDDSLDGLSQTVCSPFILGSILDSPYERRPIYYAGSKVSILMRWLQ